METSIFSRELSLEQVAIFPKKLQFILKSTYLAGAIIWMAFFTTPVLGQNVSACDGLVCPDVDLSIFHCIQGSNKFSELTLPQNNMLLPYPACLTQAQHVIFPNLVEVDIPNYAFAPGSEIIILGGNTLIVNSGCKLTLTNTYVHGCSSLWNSIVVYGTLSTDSDTRIEDGYKAIFMTPNASLSCEATTFNGNYISLNVLGTIGLHKIVGCTFSGSKQLLSPVNDDPQNLVTTNKPVEGIHLEDVPMFTIGSSASSNLNIFKDFQRDNNLGTIVGLKKNQVCGIHLVRSSAVVGHSQFENFLPYPTTPPDPYLAVGILSGDYSATTLSSLTINGNGIASNSPHTFQNCFSEVVAINTGVNISNCSSENCNFGFLMLPSLYNFVLVQGNGFREHHNTAIACYPYNVLGLPQTIQLNSNNISFGGTTNSAQDAHFGIRCNTYPANATSCKINDNVIIENGIIPTSGFLGILLDGLSNAEVKNNTITDNSVASVSPFTGIQVGNALGVQIKNNTVNGNSLQYSLPSPFLSGLLSAMYIQHSENAVVQCNSVNNVNKGITIGPGLSIPLDLNYNTFNSHDVGLYLEEGAIIGVQDRKDNIWNGPSGTADGLIHLPGYPSLNTISTLNKSVFAIGTTPAYDVPGNTRWANPRYINAGSLNAPLLIDDVPMEAWFIQAPQTIPQICGVAQPPNEGLTKLDEDVIEGGIESISGHEATIWDAKFHTYDRLLRLPELRPANSTALAWYETNANTSYAKLAVAYEASLALGPVTSMLEATESLETSLSDLGQKNIDWAAATSISEKDQIEGLMPELTTAVASARVAFDTQLAAFTASQTSVRQVILNNISGLQLNSPYEEDFRSVISILLEAGIAGGNLSTPQVEALRTVAEKCRLAGGVAVDLARQALNIEPPILPIDFDCDEAASPRSDAVVKNENLPALFPNPTTGNINLQWPDKIDKGVVTVLDILGKPLHSWEIEDTKQFSSDNLSLPAGTYFLTVSISGQTPVVLRFSNIK